LTARIGLTGPPGSGKTTIAKKAVILLNSLGCKTSGFYTPEVRNGGHRLGFQVEEIGTGNRVWLAKRNAESKYKVGSYGVLDEAGFFMYNILKNASKADFIVIDEIGPMELVFPIVRAKIKEILVSAEKFIVVYHRKLRHTHPDIYRIISERALKFWVDRNNRDDVWSEIESILISACKK
jgi:nucleoside-triphosphatase